LRLKLRAHRIEDFSDCARMWGDPAVTKFIGGKPFTPEESWARLLRYVGHWSMLHFGNWAVEEKSTGAFLGEVGFAEHQREIQPSLNGIPEAGWVFHPSAQGKGYAGEALQAALVWADQNLPALKTCCIIHPENLPSIRLAEKSDYVLALRSTYHGAPTLIFYRDARGIR
jgi:RimJ/RimL family protein N-acetyltransferase